MNKKKESKVVPNVRFKGFTDDWKQCKLGDIADVTKLAGFEFTEHVVYSDEGNIIALRGLNIKNGQLILDDVKYIDGSNFSKLSRSKLFIDDIMFTYVGTVGEVAIIKENDRFYLAPNVSRIRVKSDDSPKFISHYMRTDNFKNKVIFPLIATSSQPALSMENIRKFTINIPISREEQDCLAKYFDSLDRLITLHQQKITLLTKLKKAMLEKMFPKKGTVIPEFRFSGFANAWEQRKLNEVLSFLKDGTHGTHADDENGPLLLSAKNIKNGKIICDETDRRISEEEYEKIHTNFSLEVGDVLLTIVGSIGETAILKDCSSITFQRSVAFLRPNGTITSDFLYSEIQTQKFQNELDSRKSTSAQPGIYLGDLSEIPIVFTTNLDEQTKIGDYFNNLDHLITLHQRKIDMLRKLKSACLSEMFI